MHNVPEISLSSANRNPEAIPATTDPPPATPPPSSIPLSFLQPAHGGISVGVMAATATQRGKSQSHLHRDFPSPVLKSWGNHRLLRCDAIDGNEHVVTGKHRSIHPRDDRRRNPRSDASEIAIGNEESGLEELREKLLGHLREVAGRMKLEVPRIDPSGSGSDAIPWNLRSKRVSRNEAAQAPSRRDSDKDPQKFSVSLTQEEIDEDFFALTGSRPRRRPKKRARIVQRQLDAIFPGLWLSEITPELYRVPE